MRKKRNQNTVKREEWKRREMGEDEEDKSYSQKSHQPKRYRKMLDAAGCCSDGRLSSPPPLFRSGAQRQRRKHSRLVIGVSSCLFRRQMNNTQHATQHVNTIMPYNAASSSLLPPCISNYIHTHARTHTIKQTHAHTRKNLVR